MVVDTPSILITDDDCRFRETLREVLEPEGYRTLLAADGQEAYEIVQHNEVHVVLLDMHMPRLTGLETIRLVKRFKALLPCILISAELDEDLRAEAVKAHAFDVLRKPVSRFDLTQIVHQALRRTYGWG